MLKRLRSFLSAPNKPTLFRYFVQEVRDDLKSGSHQFLDHFSRKERLAFGKLNFGNSLYNSYGDHRSGWTFAVHALKPLHNPKGILFDPFIERTFAWNPQRVVFPHRCPWVGIIHVPPNVPSWFPNNQSNQAIFNTEGWKISYPFCRGLFTLSDYHRRELLKILDLPVNNLIHPTEFPNLVWTWERFNRNKEKKIIQVGWWLRKLYSIYLLPVTSYQKVFLRKDETGMDYILKKELEHTAGKEKLTPDMIAKTRVLNFVSPHKYDQLLSENIIFIDLHDASANNAVIECIVRNTPILVNPIEPVLEYLGKDYPFYFSSLEEARHKAEDMDLIRATHYYLCHHPIKAKLTGDYFRKSLIESPIYQSI
ncbi:MAG: hypothetical protein M0P58_12765 [Bacteroidales bacterium]|nr:hypothetical protein [Bacteroidales bacterium]